MTHLVPPAEPHLRLPSGRGLLHQLLPGRLPRGGEAAPGGGQGEGRGGLQAVPLTPAQDGKNWRDIKQCYYGNITY